MSKHSAPRSRRAPRRKIPVPLVVLLVAGAVGTLVAWFHLVGAAIEFGELALAGVSQAWVFTGAASFGAVLCLLLVMVLTTRALRTAGVLSEYQPRRAGGRRAAVRTSGPTRSRRPRRP